jgi:hypothetical protein
LGNFPDLESAMSSLARRVFETSAVLVLLAAAGSGCAYSVFAAPQPFDFKPPPGQGWDLAYSAAVQNGRIDEYVPTGDDLESWHELMTVLRTYRMLGQSRRDVFEGLQKVREKECPGSTKWNLVEESDDRLIYEWWAAPCLGFPDQYEIAVLVDGTRDRVKLSYTVKSIEVDPTVREAWLAVMREARFGEAPTP